MSSRPHSAEHDGRPGGSDEGAALPAVLAVLTVILVLCTAVASHAALQHRYVQHDLDRLQARYAAESGINVAIELLESRQVRRADGETVKLPAGLSARVTIRPYGGFYEIESLAQVRSQRHGTRAVVGDDHSLLRQAVVLGDASTAMHVAGATRITGDLMLGRRGLRREVLDGRTFRGAITGSIGDGGDQPLPTFDSAHIEDQLAWLDAALESPPRNAAVVEPGGRLPEDPILIIRGSARLSAADSGRWKQPVTLLVQGSLELTEGFSAPPGSRIAARGEILTRPYAGVHAGIVYARRSVVIDGSRLAGQFFARDSIVVRGGAYLDYPSLLYVSGREVGTERHGSISIIDQSTVDGTIVYAGQTADDHRNRGRITVEAGALVRGAVLSTSQTSLQGTVHGTVLTHQFIHYASPRSLINWIVDASVLLPDRPVGFLLPVVLGDDARLEVLSRHDVPPPSLTALHAPTRSHE